MTPALFLKVDGEAQPRCLASQEQEKSGPAEGRTIINPQHLPHHCLFPIESSQLAVLHPSAWQPLISEDKSSIDSNLSCVRLSLKLKIAFREQQWRSNGGAMAREPLKLVEIILALL